MAKACRACVCRRCEFKSDCDPTNYICKNCKGSGKYKCENSIYKLYRLFGKPPTQEVKK